MAYRALYRQYRPRTFAEVVGQEHITTILKNQVAANRLAHAYLFCGTRGTGKTSTAKILARASCCLSPDNGEPCGTCSGCLHSADENNTDIIEIDAASNNRVDDVRALLEQAQYAPMQLKMRVFIVDEAHMLSASAFNALLKTLEEPPPHILFILATTEPQKLPATIISRCQRFDFHRHTVENIVAYLKTVLEKAGASIDDEGLNAIARAADGGMRDALSLADQCLSFCGDHVRKQDVYDVLGSMEQGFLFEIAGALIASDAQKAIRMLDDIVRGGRDLAVFCQDLSSHFRALLLAKTCGACADILECTDDAMRQYLEQAKTCSAPRLLLATEALLRAESDMRYLAVPRTMLESTLVRICRPEEELSLAALEARVDRLEAGGVKFVQPALAAAPLAEDAPIAAPEAKREPVRRAEPAAPAPEKETAKNELTKPEPSAPEAASAPAEPSAPGTLGAGGLWSIVLAELHKQNILVHMMAKDGVALSLDGGLLRIGFDEKHETQYTNMNAPINQTKLQGIVDKVAPGTRIAFARIRQAADAGASDADVERARALFGDRLTIE
ncbi:MAG: DNA polymerase III subunit gamma/tau [Clostridia bacterium]|nr:DNA polymerase III subunit gamma/tau [Clostridia bacterium]